MRVLIAGAGGLVGRALEEHYGSRSEVFALRHRDLDITDENAVREAVESIAPDLLFNCAVISVDECEVDPARAHAVNVAGPGHLARAASDAGASFIHFSSNYVFGGDRSDHGFYETGDPAKPVNVYGVTKLEGEHRVMSECTRSWIIRTSWVFGEGKESFLATVPRKLRDGERVTAIDDTFASATWVEDLVERVHGIVETDDTGIFHVVNDGVCSYAEFAEEAANILDLSDQERRRLIERKSESLVQRPARRPEWTPMFCDHSQRAGMSPLRSWQQALRAYISRRD